MRNALIFFGILFLVAALPFFFLDQDLIADETGLGSKSEADIRAIAAGLDSSNMQQLGDVLRSSKVPGDFDALRSEVFGTVMPEVESSTSDWSSFERETLELQKERWAEVARAERFWLNRMDAASAELILTYDKFVGASLRGGTLGQRIRQAEESRIKEGVALLRGLGMDDVRWEDVLSDVGSGRRGGRRYGPTVRLVAEACTGVFAASSKSGTLYGVVACLESLAETDRSVTIIETGLASLGPWAGNRQNRAFVSRLATRLSALRAELAPMTITTIRTRNGVRMGSTTVDAVVHWKSDLDFLSQMVTELRQTDVPWVFLEDAYDEFVARCDEVDAEVARIPTGGFGRF